MYIYINIYIYSESLLLRQPRTSIIWLHRHFEIFLLDIHLFTCTLIRVHRQSTYNDNSALSTYL